MWHIEVGFEPVSRSDLSYGNACLWRKVLDLNVRGWPFAWWCAERCWFSDDLGAHSAICRVLVLVGFDGVGTGIFGSAKSRIFSGSGISGGTCGCDSFGDGGYDLDLVEIRPLDWHSSLQSWGRGPLTVVGAVICDVHRGHHAVAVK